MTNPLPDTSINENKYPSDIETLFSRRRHDVTKEDNTPWLITLADLLTILLVFSFVLVAVNQVKDKSIVSQTTVPETVKSIVPLAHAGSQPSCPSIPLRAYNRPISSSSMYTEDEKTVWKSSFMFDVDTEKLPARYLQSMHELAEIALKNPGTKIIISTNMHTQSNISFKRAQQVTDYLTEICAIAKNRIFIQAFPYSTSTARAISSEANNEEKPLEVKLIKAFWSL